MLLEKKEMHESPELGHRLVYTRQKDTHKSLSILVHACECRSECYPVIFEWKSWFTGQEIPRERGAEVRLEFRDKCATLAEVWNAELSPSDCLRSWLCISAPSCLRVSRLPVWPQFIIYPQLIGVGVIQKNAARSHQPINGFNFPIRCGTLLESIKEAGPLGKDNDPHWPFVCTIDFPGYKVAWM